MDDRVPTDSLARALANVTGSSAGGAPFLFAFGCTLMMAGVLGFSLPDRTTALITLFQGNVALPLAFLIERRLCAERMTRDNPLRALSIQLAFSQLFALPSAIVVYAVAPGFVPAMVAFAAAAHLVPYAWLQRTRVYIWAAAAVSAGATLLAMAIGEASGPWVLMMMAAVYWVSAALIYRRATSLAHAERLLHAPAAP